MPSVNIATVPDPPTQNRSTGRSTREQRPQPDLAPVSEKSLLEERGVTVTVPAG